MLRSCYFNKKKKTFVVIGNKREGLTDLITVAVITDKCSGRNVEVCGDLVQSSRHDARIQKRNATNTLRILLLSNHYVRGKVNE